jgi:hypothetical protein
VDWRAITEPSETFPFDARQRFDVPGSAYDLGYFDDETCRLEPIANRFGPKVLPMSPE